MVGAQIDAVDVVVFVSALVLHVEDMPTGERPEIHVNPAIGVVGDRFRGVGVVRRTHPDIQYPIDRRQVGDLLTIRAQLQGGFVRVTEEDMPVDQLHRLRVGREYLGERCHDNRSQHGC